MEELKETLEALSVTMSSRMTAFETQLKQSQSSPRTLETLTTDFDNFRTFVLATIKMLEKQVALLTKECDNMEMRSRRNMLLVHGVPETADEDSCKIFVDLTGQHLGAQRIGPEVVSRCVRLGRLRQGKPRPLLVQFNSDLVRNRIWYAKTGFKGTGVTLSEFLTKFRHGVFLAAREKFGVSKCWTRDGRIFVVDNVGKRHLIASVSDVENLDALSVLGSGKQAVADAANSAKVQTASSSITGRSKRALHVAAKRK